MSADAIVNFQTKINDVIIRVYRGLIHAGFQGIHLKLKRTEPGGSILLLKLTKLTNLTKPKLMKKNVIQM